MSEKRMQEAAERVQEFGFETALIYQLMTLIETLKGIDLSLYEMKDEISAISASVVKTF